MQTYIIDIYPYLSCVFEPGLNIPNFSSVDSTLQYRLNDSPLTGDIAGSDVVVGTSPRKNKACSFPLGILHIDIRYFDIDPVHCCYWRSRLNSTDVLKLFRVFRKCL